MIPRVKTKQSPRQEEGNMYIYLEIFRGKLKAVAGLQINKIISLGFLKESLPLLTIGGGKRVKGEGEEL